MNTNSPSFRALVLAGALLGTLATASFAGPGPQYWIRPAKPSAPAAKSETPAPVATACAGCKTTNIVTVSDRGPAGKGVPGARIAGTKHECSLCSGSVSREDGKSSGTITHTAACGSIACCK
jgi:hypothetical protein